MIPLGMGAAASRSHTGITVLLLAASSPLIRGMGDEPADTSSGLGTKRSAEGLAALQLALTTARGGAELLGHPLAQGDVVSGQQGV